MLLCHYFLEVRLATAVRKTVVLACWDGCTGPDQMTCTNGKQSSISYHTVEFEGVTQRGRANYRLFQAFIVHHTVRLDSRCSSSQLICTKEACCQYTQKKTGRPNKKQLIYAYQWLGMKCPDSVASKKVGMYWTSPFDFWFCNFTQFRNSRHLNCFY